MFGIRKECFLSAEIGRGQYSNVVLLSQNPPKNCFEVKTLALDLAPYHFFGSTIVSCQCLSVNFNHTGNSFEVKIEADSSDTTRSSTWLHIHIRIFAYSSTSYGTPNIYKCFRFPVLLNTTDILLGILFDYTTLHRVTIIKRLTLR